MLRAAARSVSMSAPAFGSTAGSIEPPAITSTMPTTMMVPTR